MGRVEGEERESDSKASIGGQSDRRDRCERGFGQGDGGLYVEEVAVKSRKEERETGVG